jgi:uroporphyrinogen-III synthase
MKPLVILRPEPGASATASAAGKLGLATMVMPLFVVEPIAWRAPSAADFDGLLLTSANAVRHAGKELERLNILEAHCVGETTASEASNAGFEVASVGSSGIDALLRTLPAGLRLLHLSGVERREATNPQQIIERVHVYRAVQLPPPANLDRLEGAVVAAHSPRAAARLLGLVRGAGLRQEKIAVAAMSEAAALAAGTGWECLEFAPEPTDAALLALAVELCNNRQ